MEGVWHKVDGLGYETLAEVLISRLLKPSVEEQREIVNYLKKNI